MIIIYVDPTAGAGVPALIGEHAMRKPGSAIYVKTGAGDTAWSLSPYGGGAGGYNTYENAGVPVTQRTTTNLSAQLLAADSGGKTALSIASIDQSLVTGLAEAAQDAVGAALTDTAEIDFTYNDGANTISALVGAIATSKVTGLDTALAGKATRFQHQVFDASGTYTPTAGMLYCLAIVTGSGGGGGGADTGAGGSGDVGVGGGGGGGETRFGVFSAATIGASVAVTINAVGAAGSNAGGNGGNGGTAVFGAHITANGGTGGTGSGSTTQDGQNTNGGAGGTGGTGGLFAVDGQDGDDGFAGSADGTTDISFGRGGSGGSTWWGGGGAAVARAKANLTTDATVAGKAGKASGAGGSGAVDLDSTTGQAGGAGKIGRIWVVELVA